MAGWLFVTEEGIVARASDFLGPLVRVGELPSVSGFSGASDGRALVGSRGRLVGVSADGAVTELLGGGGTEITQHVPTARAAERARRHRGASPGRPPPRAGQRW